MEQLLNDYGGLLLAGLFLVLMPSRRLRWLTRLGPRWRLRLLPNFRSPT